MALVVVNSDKEAYADQYSSGTPHENCLVVEADPGAQKMSYIGFDIASSPADVLSVLLYLYRPDDGVFSPILVDIYRVTDSWDASTLTWNSRPSATSVNGIDAVKLPERNGWKSYDVTSMYGDAKTAGDDFGVRIAEKDSGDYRGPRNRLTAGVTYLYIEAIIPPLAFADVAISRRWGDKLYLSGKLEHIQASDEICIKYFRPEDGTVHNLPSGGRDYTYLKGVSGTYTFPDDTYIPVWTSEFVSGHWEGNNYISAHYEDKNLPGLWVLLVDDVSGTCESVIRQRAQHPVSILEPRYQYQQVFKTANLDFPEAVSMLEGRRREWARVTDKRVEPYGEDCFSVRLKYSGGWDNATALVWLCSAYQARIKAEFAPLPLWAVPDSTDYLKYLRGECDCADFQDSRGYGVPCVHIMAAYYFLDRKPPYCGYVKCD